MATTNGVPRITRSTRTCVEIVRIEICKLGLLPWPCGIHKDETSPSTARANIIHPIIKPRLQPNKGPEAATPAMIMLLVNMLNTPLARLNEAPVTSSGTMPYFAGLNSALCDAINTSDRHASIRLPALKAQMTRLHKSTSSILEITITRCRDHRSAICPVIPSSTMNGA